MNGIRIGHGYDVHRLAEGRQLFIGGVLIPHKKGAEGHSDADVLLHAICDALLGAAALRDIGYHFPDTNDAYKGISSLVLLRDTKKLIGEKGYKIGNIDATVIAQAPKISPFIPAMQQKLAEELGLPDGCISVKATTEEKLGFTGAEEGIAAHAVVLIYK